ncbi:MAG: cyclic nucleotide-binding domain-containing protein [Terriglobia bacterium]
MGVEVSRLGSFDLFAGLAPQDLAFIAANCTETKIPSGTVFIQQGQVGKEVYLLEAGSVQVYRGEAASPQIQAVLQAPTIVGEMAMVDPTRIRTSSVLSLNDLRLLTVPIKTFLVFVRSYPSLKEKLRQVIAARS